MSKILRFNQRFAKTGAKHLLSTHVFSSLNKNNSFVSLDHINDHVKDWQKTQPWGKSVMVDYWGCDNKKISDKKHIEQWVVELCDLIKMKRFGDPQVVHFGTGPQAGYTAVQLIETSCVAAHFAEGTNTMFLDLFSCAPFNENEVAEFTKDKFSCLGYKAKAFYRG